MKNYDSTGEKNSRTIILLHGGGVTRVWWRPQMEALADEFRMIAPDLVGHGARARAPFSLDQAVEDTETLVRTEAAGRALLVGISLGGYTAMAHANRYPNSSVGLILSGSSLNMTGLTGLGFRLTGAFLKFKGVDFIREGTIRGFEKRIPPEYLTPVLDAGLHIETAMGAFGKIAGNNFLKMMRGYPKPVLLLNGFDDEPNRKQEEKFINAIPLAHLQIVERAGHLANLEQPETYTAAVRSFANSLDW